MINSRASGDKALVWGPRTTTVVIAVHVHGYPHIADTPDDHLSSVASNGWNASMALGPSTSVAYLGLLCVVILQQCGLLGMEVVNPQL
jgi:hypothetical protein